MSANPVARPQSRRAFFGALAALPAISAPAARAEEEADAELLAWVDRLDVCSIEKKRLQPSQDAAAIRWSEACKRASLRRKEQGIVISADDSHEEMLRVAIEVGLHDHPIEAVQKEIEELGEKIVRAMPTTIAGLMAKARYVARWFLKEEDFADDLDDMDWDLRVLRTFVEDVCRLAGHDIRTSTVPALLPRRGRERS